METWLNNFNIKYGVEVKDLSIELGNETLDIKPFKKFLESLGAKVSIGFTSDTLIDSVRLTSSDTIKSMYFSLRNKFIETYTGEF